MSNLKTLAIAIGSGILSLIIFKNLYISYQTGRSLIKFGNYVHLADSPVVYWISMFITFGVAWMLLWLAISLLRHLLSTE